MTLTLEQLMAMDRRGLAEIVARANPIEPGSLDDTTYLGVDLSLPPFMHKLLWLTFRKTFHRDPTTGELRGWNVRLEQTGLVGPKTVMRRRDGTEKTFGHYLLRSARGVRFPGDWQGADFLDYSDAGNPVWDLARLGHCPLVSVNAGSSELLLGWEVFRVGPLFIPLRDYWALQREGPLPAVVAPPRPKRNALPAHTP